MNAPNYVGQRRGGSGGGGIGGWPGSGGGSGQHFRYTNPLLRPRFNMNSYLRRIYRTLLQNRSILGQGGPTIYIVQFAINHNNLK